MERFSKEILVQDKSRLFIFTRMENVNGVKFFITTNDDKMKPMSFSLIRAKDHHWKLTPGSQRWLYAIEAELSEAIRETRLN